MYNQWCNQDTSEYMTYVLEAFELEDTTKNYERRKSTGWKYTSSIRPARTGNLGSLFDTSVVMGKMYKKKQADGHGPPREHTDMQEQDMDIRKIMKDVENFSYSHMSWKERKKVENRKVVSLGGKAPKNQRLPLSVARPMMKKQKEREQKMLQEHMILGRFGGKVGGSSSKKPVGKQKHEDRGLKLSGEGRFRNGILDVKHLVKSTPSKGRDTGMSNAGKRNGGQMKYGDKMKYSNKGASMKHY